MEEEKNEFVEEQEIDVQDLDDEALEAISGGGVGRKLMCPRGTVRVCGTRDGVYKCYCDPR